MLIPHRYGRRRMPKTSHKFSHGAAVVAAHVAPLPRKSVEVETADAGFGAGIRPLDAELCASKWMAVP